MKNTKYNNIKWMIRPMLYALRNRIKNQKSDWIMGRVACMGQDVLKLLAIEVPMINVQKGRVDYLNDISEHPKYKIKISQVVSAIERNDIKGLMLQQQILYGFNKKPPIALYMDSFSELTDQRFYHKTQKWSFCANYSDIKHTPKFERMFESQGLIPLHDLLECYRKFFIEFRQIYGPVPIIFMHFPIKLDTRVKFHERFSAILKAVEQIKLEFSHFYSFTVDSNIVDWPEEKLPGLENFPYHYNIPTYQYLVDQIRSSGVLRTILKEHDKEIL